MELRPYQVPLVEAARDAIARRQSMILVAPTGSGKTVCFAYLTAQCAAKGQAVTILVHRHELMEQVSATLTAFGVEHGCIAPSYPWHRKRPVQVASVMSLRNRLADYPSPDVLICDEAHHCCSPSYQKIFDAYAHAARLGFTATPERLDGKGLMGQFGAMFVGPQPRELMDLGALCDYRLFAPPVTYTNGLHRRMGDYDQKALAEVTDTPSITGDAIEHYRSLSPGQRALVFTVTISHARHVAARFVDAGHAAASIDGTMVPAERHRVISDFASGRCGILTSCDLVSEGYDCPGIEVAILLRPTMSLGRYLQQVGRALRPYPGKTRAIILDHAGNSSRHGFPDDVRDWTLEGRAKKAKGDAGEVAVSARTCGACYLAVRAPALACPYCGTVFPIVAREVVEVAGELVEVDRLAARREQLRDQGRARDLAALQALGKQRGHRPAWAWMVWNARSRKQGAYHV